MQLVDLVDRCSTCSRRRRTSFISTNVATIDDYLEDPPDGAVRIAEHVRSGRLAIGPWQILMDEFLVSGETLVRNLETGWARADGLR